MIAIWLMLAVWAGVCAVWLHLLLAQRRFARAGLLLAPNRGAAPEPLPTAQVALPVRDAFEDAWACAVTVLAQRNVSITLTIIDDRSEPECAARLRELSAGDSRIRLVRIDSLPGGWLGKTHALAASGIAESDAEWLLFLDDDCRLDDPDAVRTAIAHAEAEGCDLLTLWPRHAGGSMMEHLVVPLCGGIIAMWFGPRRSAASLRRPYANGQFILVSREAYQRIGGHASVRLHLIEDVALAEAAHAAGLRLGVASGRWLFSVRMYRTARATLEGWTRIFTGAIARPGAIVLSILWLVAGSLLPFVAAPLLGLASVGADAGGQISAPLLAADAICAAHFGLLAAVSWRFWGWGGCNRRHLALYPISAMLVAGVLARSLWQLVVRQSVEWRGTHYRIDRSGRIMAE